MKKNERGGACKSYGRERRGAYSILMVKPEAKTPLRNSSSKWNDNIKMYLQDLE
jgi:hypothetical protein